MEDVLSIVETELTGSDPGPEVIEAVTEEKTFTQYELDKIIKERIGKEKAKAQQQFEKMEKEFQQRELDLHAKQALKEKDLPSDILDALKFDDIDSFNVSLKIIENIIKDIGIKQSAGTPKGNMSGFQSGHYASGNTEKQIRDAMGITK